MQPRHRYNEGGDIISPGTSWVQRFMSDALPSGASSTFQQHVIGDRLELCLFKSRSNDKGSQGRECTVESDHNYVPTKVLQSGNQLWLTTQLSTHISDERVREGH